MIYKINRIIDCVEGFNTFEHCPSGLHTHKASFTLKIQSELPESEFLAKIDDVLTENIVYMQDKWSLGLLAEIMRQELSASELSVLQINLKLNDFDVEVEI